MLTNLWFYFGEKISGIYVAGLPFLGKLKINFWEFKICQLAELKPLVVRRITRGNGVGDSEIF